MLKKLSLTLATIFCLTTLAACSQSGAPQTASGTPELANEMTYSLDGISMLTISYDEENITFFESEDDSLAVKEYMSENSEDYYAKVSEDRNDGSIKISEGGKPRGGGFTRYVEVYLPADYAESLTATTTNGDVDFSGIDLSLAELRIDNTSGSVHCGKLSGNVTYSSTNGDLLVESAAGSGYYHTSSSGRLDVTYADVTGDLSLVNKNDGITLTLPENLAFNFEALTKNGEVNTDFPDSLTMEDTLLRGAVGDNPAVTVSVSTIDGDIEVRRG